MNEIKKITHHDFIHKPKTTNQKPPTTKTINTIKTDNIEITTEKTNPITNIIESPHSTNLLHDKLIGGLDNMPENMSKGLGATSMGLYGAYKGIIEAHPTIAIKANLTECLLESKIKSKIGTKIAGKGMEALNTASIPEQWTKYGEEAFIKTESNFATTNRLIGDNANVLRSTGARLNVAINAAFAAVDSKKVWDSYIEKGEQGTDHIGEVVGRFTGETVGGAGGFAAGMAIGTVGTTMLAGAACGSVVPGLGTAIGLLAGATIGAVCAVVGGDIGASIGSYADGNNGEIVTL